MWRLLRVVWHHPLNANGKVVAVWRVLRWQFASHLMPGLISLPDAQGTSLFAMRGMTGATGNWYCGLHEEDEMAFVLHLLRPDEHFVDVGANMDSYSVLHGGSGALDDPRLLAMMKTVGNTVFVRDKASVEARVKAAPRFKLVNGHI